MEAIKRDLYFYDTLQRKKLKFEPLVEGYVGIYLCGPTVYGHAHLGHSRSAILMDVLVRYLRHQNVRVRYVRNITDVGHLEQDADHGEDKIGKLARLQQVEPMEVAQKYTLSYQEDLAALNTLPPDIEPRATGHIIEQIQFTQQILEQGYAYEVNGSVYFDIEKYRKDHPYGELSGRNLDDLLTNTRSDLEGQNEKRGPFDFALWKKASPEHIMRWPSPWGDGFPGWHIECSAMSTKYLGTTFDIHGGGMDLMFPHHECEIAQAKAGHGHTPARYWVHCNMVTINGQKMGKSLGNFITLKELFSGNHALLERPYSPMSIRFFILQSHYRSTVDFSNEALLAAEKGYLKLLNGFRAAKELLAAPAPTGSQIREGNDDFIKEICESCYTALSDDLNTAIVLSHLFNLLKKINQWHLQADSREHQQPETFRLALSTYCTFFADILGLDAPPSLPENKLMQLVLDRYAQAKAEKNYALVDELRAQLREAGIAIKDMKSGIGWAYVE